MVEDRRQKRLVTSGSSQGMEPQQIRESIWCNVQTQSWLSDENGRHFLQVLASYTSTNWCIGKRSDQDSGNHGIVCSRFL